MAHRQDDAPVAHRYQHGVDLLVGGRPDQAADVLEPLVSAPGLIGQLSRYYAARAHRQGGMEALRAGEYEQAQRRLRQAASLAGPSANLGDFLCVLYTRAGSHDQCIQAGEQALRDEADSPQRWRRLAQAQWQAGQRTSGYMTLNQALRRLGDHACLHLQMGLFQAAEGHYELARTSLERAVTLDQADPRAHYYLGIAQAATGQAPSALASLERCCQLAGDDLVAAHQLATVARLVQASGQPVVLKLVDLSSQPAQPSQARQLARYVTGEIDFVDVFLSLPPSQADAELFGLLEEILRTALVEHEDYADLRLRLAQVLGRLGRHEEALEQGLSAVRINPDYRLARLYVGELLARTDQPAKALEHLRRVVELGGDWPDVHTQIARLLAQTGQRELARAHLGRALEINHDYSPASTELARLAA